MKKLTNDHVSDEFKMPRKIRGMTGSPVSFHLAYKALPQLDIPIYENVSN